MFTMKFRNFKDEKELMDTIDPDKKEDRVIMAEYAQVLSERYGITMDMAIDEALRLLEVKKNGEEITSIFKERLALDYKPPFVPIPRKRVKKENYGRLTEDEEIFKIQNDIYDAVRAYHDLNEEDREKMEFYVRDTVEWYSECYGMDKVKIVECLKAKFRKVRQKRPDAFEKYRDNELNRMVGTDPDPDYEKYDKMMNETREDRKSLVWSDEQK